MKRVEDLGQPKATRQFVAGTEKQRAATLGVQSLADTLEAAFGAESTPASVHSESRDLTRPANGPPTSGPYGSPAGSQRAVECSKPPSSRYPKKKLSSHEPATPPNVDAPSPMPTSVRSNTPGSASMQSLKLSDEESLLDEVASQAIASSGDEDGDEEAGETLHGASANFPQLVMPSIQMPRRRPFTTRGKCMGKIKVLIAGQSGIGKTSLIRSIVQLCDDIVHVDPITPSLSTSQSTPPKPSSRKKRINSSASARITEVHASTKPYPHWWTELDESRILRRRKSSIDAVLERNICFVDTPGCEEGATSAIVNYVESLMRQTASMNALKDSDVLCVVSGSGGVLVDVVIYLLPPNQDITKDMELMRRLSFLTNVIPVIAKSDTISVQELVALKTSILAHLQLTSIKPFLFGKPLEDALLAVQSLPILASNQINSGFPSEPSHYPFSTPTHPFAISSTVGSDDENMDASLLMSPDYVQPLLPSELPTLVTQVFDPDSISWLRHAAAKRFLAWCKTSLPRNHVRSHTLPHPHSPIAAPVGLKHPVMGATSSSSIFSVASPSGVLVPSPGSPFYASNLHSPLLASSPSLSNSERPDSPGTFSLARYTHAAQNELPLSEIRIAKWATDLHRSLRNERERFERVQREGHAKRLLRRAGEEVSGGTFFAAAGGPPRADWAVVRHGDEKCAGTTGTRFCSAGGLDSRDPLGLCTWGDEVWRHGTVLVKVLGGVSVLGAVVVAFARVMGVHGFAGQWGWWGWVTGDD